MPASNGMLKIQGALRIKDQSHPIELVARLTQPSPDRVILSAGTTIDRCRWGMSWAKIGAGLVNRLVVVAQFVRS
jgi:polyisoprenoid-binding protein YceI